jgi:hypothetical protein
VVPQEARELDDVRPARDVQAREGVGTFVAQYVATCATAASLTSAGDADATSARPAIREMAGITPPIGNGRRRLGDVVVELGLIPSATTPIRGV